VLESNVLFSSVSTQFVRRTARAIAAERRRRMAKNARTSLPKARNLGITHLRSEEPPQLTSFIGRGPAFPGKNVLP
jgi:hypothetical protein